MDENPYSAPNTASDVEDTAPSISLCCAAISGAKIGGLIGMLIVVIGGIIAGGVVLFFAIRLGMRAEGGFMYAIEHFTKKNPPLEMIVSFTAGVAVFTGWGAIIGAIAKILSVWSRRKP
jgi:hypothetical protein